MIIPTLFPSYRSTMMPFLKSSFTKPSPHPWLYHHIIQQLNLSHSLTSMPGIFVISTSLLPPLIPLTTSPCGYGCPKFIITPLQVTATPPYSHLSAIQNAFSITWFLLTIILYILCLRINKLPEKWINVLVNALNLILHVVRCLT